MRGNPPYVLVAADKVANNVTATYFPTDDSYEAILKSLNQFTTSVVFEMSEEDQNLPYLYWTPILHGSPYKHRFIAGSRKYTTKDLSCLLTQLRSTIKTNTHDAICIIRFFCLIMLKPKR